MAYLNVRERKVETKIAYVGAGRAGKATNIEQLGLRGAKRQDTAKAIGDDTGEVLSVDWTAPSANAHFRDCTVSVRVVAARGAPSPERTRAIVRDADGVVLVLDASPSAAEENREAARLLKSALAERRDVPIVVQVNKTDLDDARDATEVARDLEASWPHVGASAARGEGVVETLERALADVLAALQAQGASPETDTVRPVTGSRVEGNPLLSALRQVLRDTVSEHVAALEARFVERLESALAQSGGAEIAALRKTFVDESARTRTAVDVMTEQLDDVRRTTRELRTVVTTGLQETTRALAAHVEALQKLEEKVGDSPFGDDRLESLRSDVVKALDGRSKTDREHVSSTAIPIRRAVETLAADVKQADVKKSVAELAETIAALRARVDALGPAVEKAIAQGALARRVEAVEELVRVVVDDAEVHSAAQTQAGERLALLETSVKELVDELKKRSTEKKSWFG